MTAWRFGGLVSTCVVLASLPGLIEATIAETKLTASDGAATDRFGASVALSANSVVVGAYKDDDDGTESGSAYVFAFDGSGWVESAKLTAGDAAAEDHFGYSVAVAEQTAVVGAPRHDGSAENSGSAYVFTFDGSAWVETARLAPSDAAAGDMFSWSVGVSGNRLFVGSRDDDDDGTASGSVYVFTFDGSSWLETAKLTASDAAAGDQFGWSLAVSGDSVAVGAWTNAGSAYVFSYEGAKWIEAAKLTASDGDPLDAFGLYVGLSGSSAVVSAQFDDDNGLDSGSAYVFTFDGLNWLETAKLTAEDGQAEDHFGGAVAASGNTIIAGARSDDDSGIFSGSAYIFTFDGSEWVETEKLLASDGAVGDVFGDSVSASDERVVVGSSADDDHGSASGSAYVFSPPIVFSDGFETGDTSTWSVVVP